MTQKTNAKTIKHLLIKLKAEKTMISIEKNKIYLTLSAIAGSIIEQYDFMTFTMLAYYLNTVFFTNQDKFISTLGALSLFSIGYIGRPLGGLLFGSLGDRYGRKFSFITSILFMAISTFSIGLLPSYNSIGIMAPILLSLCRLGQGMSQGAELASAMVFVSEHINQEQSYRCGLVLSGTVLGSALSSAISYLLTVYYSETIIVAWAWRIPFIIGGCLALGAFFLRSRLAETPQFLCQQNPSINNPIRILFKDHKINILLGFSVAIMVGSMIVFYSFLPIYLTQNFQYTKSSVFSALMLGSIFMAILSPIMGKFYEQYSKLTIFITTIFMILLSMLYLFKLLEMNYIIFFVLNYVLYLTSLSVCYPSLLINIFPVSVRVTGFSFSFNLAFILASLLPSAYLYVFSLTKNRYCIIFVFLFICVSSLLGIGIIKNKYHL